MATKNVWIIVFFTCIFMLASATGSQAKFSAQASAQAATTIPYTGRLTDTSGLAVSDGGYDFVFSVYDQASGGAPLWSETQSGLPVQAGSFTAQVGSAAQLPASAAEGQKWLAVSVRGPGEAQFTPLEPRQELSALLVARPAAATAGATCAHDHLGEAWDGVSLGNQTGLTVQTIGNNKDTPAIYGINSGTGSGIKAFSAYGVGLYSVTNSPNNTAIYASGSTALKAEGKIVSNQYSKLFLSPHSLIIRGSSGMTLTPAGHGGMVIRNDSGTGEKYVSLPVSSFGTLFGAPVYIAGIDVCYQVSGASGKINATGVFKNDGASSWAPYLTDGTARTSTTRQCYTVGSTVPRVAIDNSSWVQFNLGYTGTGAASDITIYSVTLWLSELADPAGEW